MDGRGTRELPEEDGRETGAIDNRPLFDGA